MTDQSVSFVVYRARGISGSLCTVHLKEDVIVPL